MFRIGVHVGRGRMVVGTGHMEGGRQSVGMTQTVGMAVTQQVCDHTAGAQEEGGGGGKEQELEQGAGGVGIYVNWTGEGEGNSEVVSDNS